MILGSTLRSDVAIEDWCWAAGLGTVGSRAGRRTSCSCTGSEEGHPDRLAIDRKAPVDGTPDHTAAAADSLGHRKAAAGVVHHSCLSFGATLAARGKPVGRPSSSASDGSVHPYRKAFLGIDLPCRVGAGRWLGCAAAGRCCCSHGRGACHPNTPAPGLPYHYGCFGSRSSGSDWSGSGCDGRRRGAHGCFDSRSCSGGRGQRRC